ncbi:PREDICTED: plasminogen-like, partial [Branchiostoma belcheri]|uniref:Plasminogen-like n=1 Tax=Branchiostoma belcheri TaxID=7741 RepID=A0A6P4ZH21_BRABE
SSPFEFLLPGICQEGNGASYRGTASITVTGKTCQRWDSQTPHGHGFTPDNHPSAGLEHNYCRNPDRGWTWLWCYTTDPITRWENCDVPACDLDTKTACEGRTAQLSCSDRKTLLIVAANYGRTSATHPCFCGSNFCTNCRSDNSLSVVRAACQGNQQCTVTASNGVFGDPCHGVGKYLEVSYRCITVWRIWAKQGPGVAQDCPSTSYRAVLCVSSIPGVSTQWLLVSICCLVV